MTHRNALAVAALCLLTMACASRAPQAPPPSSSAPAPAPQAPPPPALAAAPAPAAAPSPAEAPTPAASPAPPEASAPASLSPAVAELVKLKQAGYSDQFLLEKVHGEPTLYSLSTDDLVALRRAGISEPVIEAMLQKSPAAAPPPLPTHMEWDSLVRQQHGFLGLGSSSNKHFGRLVVDSGKLTWTEPVSPEADFSMVGKNIKEMWLNCAPRAGENFCLELCFQTYAGDHYCFRDAGWENGENKQVLGAFDYFQKAFPATFYSRREKKSF